MHSKDSSLAAEIGNRSVDFRLEVQMKLPYLTAVRRTVCDMAQTVVRDADLASRLALATHELLENALKYAANEHAPVTLKLWVESSGRAQVTVTNASTQALYQRLHEHFQSLDKSGDSVAHYHQLLTTAMHHISGSGLGLARILAEAEMMLSCDLSGDLLSVRAEAHPGEKPR